MPTRSSSPARKARSRSPAAAEKRSRSLLLWLVGISLQAITVLWLLDTPFVAADPTRIFLAGVASLVAIAAAARHAFKSHGCVFSPSAIFFSLTTWSALVDLTIAAALVGVTSLGKFYVFQGEEYFKSSFGFGVLGWDGTFHYMLQLYLAHATLLDRPRRVAGLLWCGSILNSLPVVLLGGATGTHSATLKPSTLLNAPYILAPLLYLHAILPAASAPPKIKARAPLLGRLRAARVVDHGFALFHVAAILLHCFRAAVVLGSLSPACVAYAAAHEPALAATATDAFGPLRVQILEFFFYLAPFHGWALASAYAPPSETLACWATVAAGAYLQALCGCYIPSSAFQWVGFGPLQPATTGALFWGVAAALVALPPAYAARCWQQVKP